MSERAAHGPVPVAELCRLEYGARRAALARCCGSERWLDEIERRLPVSSARELLDAADRAFDALERADWLEAFAHHPRIGDLDRLRERFAMTADLSAREQASVTAASDRVLRALADGNRRYERRFGHLFIVCASGRSAEQMLSALERRLGHEPEHELAVAAAEQRKITRLRLSELVGG